MKTKVDKALSSGLINLKQVAIKIGTDQGNLHRRVTAGKLTETDYKKIFELFSDLIW